MAVVGHKNACKLVFCSGLFTGHFLSVSESSLGLQNRRFCMESIATIGLSWKSFLVIFGMDLCRCLEASGAFHLISSFENRHENRRILMMRTEPIGGIWAL